MQLLAKLRFLRRFRVRDISAFDNFTASDQLALASNGPVQIWQCADLLNYKFVNNCIFQNYVYLKCLDLNV